MNYMEGLRAGEYLLYFPYFLVMTFVISVQEDFRELKFVLPAHHYFCVDLFKSESLRKSLPGKDR